MKDIICPHCQEAFTIDEAGYAEIQKQVRNSEFNQEIHERLEIAEREKKAAVELAETKAKSEMQETRAAKDTQLQELQAQLEAAEMAKTLAVTTAVSEAEKERDTFKNSLEQVKLTKELATKALEDQHAVQIKDRDDEIKRLGDFRARLSTKMVGQSLENHCEATTLFIRCNMILYACIS